MHGTYSDVGPGVIANNRDRDAGIEFVATSKLPIIVETCMFMMGFDWVSELKRRIGWGLRVF